MYGTSGTMLRLRVLEPAQAAEVLACEGFPAQRLDGEQAAYARHLVELLERTEDAADAEAIVFAVALMTGVDTGAPGICAGCGCFTEKAFLRGGRCPDCDGEN